MSPAMLSAGSALTLDDLHAEFLKLAREVEDLRAQIRPLPGADDMTKAPAVAKLLGMHVVTLDRLVKAGRFPPPDSYVGDHRQWKRSTVLEWIAKHSGPRPRRPLHGAAAATSEQRREYQKAKRKGRRS